MARETKNVEITDPVMPEKVAVMLPVIPGEPDTVFVGLNGKGYTIERGVTVMVPPAVKDIIDESEARKQLQLRKIRELEAEARRPRTVGM